MDHSGLFKTYGEPFIDIYKRSLKGPQAFETARRDFSEVWRALVAESQSRPVFVKDMAYHVLPFLDQHAVGMAAHTFLTRDPRLSIPSLYRMRPDFLDDQPGFDGQLKLVREIEKLGGRSPFVMDGETLKLDAKTIVAAYFRYIGFEAPDEILSWAKGSRADWVDRESWHLDAINSEGFSGEPSVVNLKGLPRRVLDFIERNEPVYEQIMEWAYRPR